MDEEYELYPVKCEDEDFLVFYRGKRDHQQAYLDLENSEKVDVEHEGTVWGGYRDDECEYYDRSEPEICRERSFCNCMNEEMHEEPEPEIEEKVVEEKVIRRTIDIDLPSITPFGAFLTVFVTSLIAIVLLLYIAGPYTLVVF